MAVAMPDQRIFGLYLVSALLLAFLSYLYFRYAAKTKKPDNMDKSFFAFVFDRDVYTHPSAKQDYLYFFVNGLLYVGIISQLLISVHFFMLFFYNALQNSFGIQDTALMSPSLLSLVLYTLVYTLLLDFAVFITHYAQHKVPILWEFHKVHHSAEVLTPITLYRMHPVDLFFSGLVIALMAGLAFAGFYYLTGETPEVYKVMGINIAIFLFYLLGYNLRHTHVWLSYPGWLSHILISPAQHQIHHSTAPKHIDKNMGLIFAFWDWAFKTLYTPAGYEKISYGINKKEPNPFASVWALYIQPFKKAWKIICPDKESREKGFIFALVLIFCIANYSVFLMLDQRAQAKSNVLPSVHIEDLTWTEVQRSLDQGYDTIIIPTGGTEQNGPHLVIGKHYYVVRHTSGAIAEKLGNTLVAPVISYVPEDVHMEWPGTISVSERIFEGLLEAAAESYVAHGFKNILFIGDSFGNQSAQEKIAHKLSKRRKKDNVTVVHISAYYSANSQTDWLINEGYTKEQIGGHAGIRDTSEMMFINPDGVRSQPVIIKNRVTGNNGDPALANAKIGETMTNLKIEAALKQIRALIPGKKTLSPSSEKNSY